MSTTLVGVIPPPPGVTANFVNPESNAWQDYPPAAVALFLSTLFLAIRLYTKARILHMWGLEDLFCVLSWMFCVTFISCILARIRIGKGRHLWNVPKTPEFRFFSLYTEVGAMCFPMATMFAKLSLLWFYRRIWPQRPFQIVVALVMFLVVGYSTAVFIVYIFRCNPVARSFNSTIKEGSCIDLSTMGTTNAGLNIATDIIVGILPLVMMRNVRLPTRAKLGVSFIFVLGSGTIVVAILRITLQAPKGTLDYTWELTCGAIASILETGLSVVCACIPVLRPFLRHVFPNTFYESYGASYYVDNSYGRGGSRQWNTSAAQKSGAIASRSWELGARSDAAQRAGTGDNIDEDIEKDSMNDTILGHQEKHAYLVHVSDHGLPGSSTELWPENLRNMNNESQGGAARLVISPSISPSEKRIMFLGKFGA